LIDGSMRDPEVQIFAALVGQEDVVGLDVGG
jgi:hypothetical protein